MLASKIKKSYKLFSIRSNEVIQSPAFFHHIKIASGGQGSTRGLNPFIEASPLKATMRRQTLATYF